MRLIEVIKDPPNDMMVLVIDRLNEGDTPVETLLMALLLVDVPPGKIQWIMNYLLEQGVVDEETTRTARAERLVIARQHPEWLLATLDDQTREIRLKPENMTLRQHRQFGLKVN